MAKKKRALKKKSAKRKSPAKKKATKQNRVAGKKGAGRERNRAGKTPAALPVAARRRRDLDPESAGQSGDVQGLSRRHLADSESVEELAEEGQYFEAEAVSGVESAKDPDQGEVTTSEVPEDDVPPEYDNQD